VESIDYLSFEDLVEIGKALIPDIQIRDIGLLESASLRPQMSVYGKDAYPTFSEKVAALMHSIARNHSLVDGNKRLSWSAGRIFCLINKRDLIMGVDEAEALIQAISKGELAVPEIAKEIEPYIKKGKAQ